MRTYCADAGSSPTIADNTITVTYGASANNNILNQTLTLTATNNTGAVEWACTASFANKWLPASCRQ